MNFHNNPRASSASGENTARIAFHLEIRQGRERILLLAVDVTFWQYLSFRFAHKHSELLLSAHLLAGRFSFVADTAQLGLTEMRLRNFFILGFMCLFTAATHADEADTEITTDLPSTTLGPETTFDSRQNEIDSELSRGDEEATPTKPSDEPESIEPEEEKTLENSATKSEATDETTIEIEASSLATEKSSNDGQTTKKEEIEMAQKLEALERASVEASTTKRELSTTETPNDERKLSARAQVIRKITKMLRAYVLRAYLTALVEVKRRQNLEAQDSLASASEVIERALPAALAAPHSDYADGKIIVFDEIEQRHVLVDKKDYDRAIRRLQNRNRSMDYVSDEQFPSPTFVLRN